MNTRPDSKDALSGNSLVGGNSPPANPVRYNGSPLATSQMAAAQLPVKHYGGRFFWSGPSVIVDDLQDVLGATRVKCIWDELDSRFVVYPRAYSREAITLMRSLDEADILSIYFFVKAGRQPHKRLAENCLKTIHSKFGLKVALLKAVTTERV